MAEKNLEQGSCLELQKIFTYRHLDGQILFSNNTESLEIIWPAATTTAFDPNIHNAKD